MNRWVMKSCMTSMRMCRRKAMVRPGRQPTWPSTDCAGIEYRDREFSSQSAQRVIQERVGSRMRCRVVTPPTFASAKGLTSSDSVPGVQTVSESRSTVMSCFDISVPIFTALRLPGIGVCTQRTSGANSSQTCSRPGFRAPLMTTMTSSGCCSVTRVRTSRNRSSGSSTTGTITLVVSWCSATHGRYRRDRPTLSSQSAQTRAEKTVNR